MDKLKEAILKITSDTKVITENQLFKLLMTYHVRLSSINYNIIYRFLNENEISLISGEENDKKYSLAK